MDIWGFLGSSGVKNLPAMQKMQVRSLGGEDLLEKEMATCSSILAWKNPMDRGAWWATVHGVTKGQTRLSGCTTATGVYLHSFPIVENMSSNSIFPDFNLKAVFWNPK